MKNKRGQSRLKRRQRIRLRICGNSLRPRLVVHRSLRNLFAEVIDDTKNKTLFSWSTLDKNIKTKLPETGNLKQAHFFGEAFGAKAKEKGISKIVFDRAGYLYHGRIKAFVEGLRKAGLEF